jgi:NAD(P)-dependent dehydrogenase (short-subunit alcohol dehydrogenase family)
LLRSQGAKLALLYAPFEAKHVDSIIDKTYGSVEDDSIRTYACDIAKPESVQEAFQAISTDNTAFPNILINSAGYVNLTPLEDTPAQDALLHYMINVHGPMLTAQAFFKLYLDRRAKSKDEAGVLGGRIVNIASQAGHVALLNHGAYCSSKAGLMGLTRCMASEWGSKGITANTVSPGPVWTALGKSKLVNHVSL